MNKNQVSKILNDPVYGFITLNKGILFDLIDHHFFGLSRIKQLGLTYLVLSGAHHTEFHRADDDLRICKTSHFNNQRNGYFNY